MLNLPIIVVVFTAKKTVKSINICIFTIKRRKIFSLSWIQQKKKKKNIMEFVTNVSR